jgi:hypothetical protein
MNPFQNQTDIFFQRIADLQHSLFYFDTVLNQSYWQTSKKIAESKEDQKNVFGMLSRLVISDITGPNDSGWEYNYATGFQKVVWFDTLRSEIDSLLSRESGFMIAQAHEAFESFLKIQVATAFYNKKVESQLKEFKKVDLTSIESCIGYVSRKIRPEINNDVYFKALREICPEYLDFEINNNLKHDLYAFYFVIAEIRHALTHSELIIKRHRLKNFSSEHFDILTKFKISKETDLGLELVIRKLDGDQIIKRLSEIAFTIYKALSIQFGFEWMILKK